MQQTSIEAKDRFNASGKKQKHNELIMKALGIDTLSTMAIASRCILNRHQVAMRIKELVLDGKIECVGKGYCLINNANVLHYKKVEKQMKMF